MKVLIDLTNRANGKALRPLDILMIAAIIFAGVIVIIAFTGSIICAIGVIVWALIASSFSKLLMLIPCAAVFSVSSAVFVFVYINIFA